MTTMMMISTLPCWKMYSPGVIRGSSENILRARISSYSSEFILLFKNATIVVSLHAKRLQTTHFLFGTGCLESTIFHTIELDSDNRKFLFHLNSTSSSEKNTSFYCLRYTKCISEIFFSRLWRINLPWKILKVLGQLQ